MRYDVTIACLFNNACVNFETTKNKAFARDKLLKVFSFCAKFSRKIFTKEIKFREIVLAKLNPQNQFISLATHNCDIDVAILFFSKCDVLIRLFSIKRVLIWKLLSDLILFNTVIIADQSKTDNESIDLQVDLRQDKTSLVHGRPDPRDLTIASRIGDGKFLTGSTRCNTITPVIAEPRDITHR